MVLGKLFSFKRSKSKEEVLEEKELHKSQETESSKVQEESRTQVPKIRESKVQEPKIEASELSKAKLNNANVAYSLHDVNRTSFSPRLSIDASVYTEPNNLIETREEGQQIIETSTKNGNGNERNGKQVQQMEEEEKKDKIENDKKRYSFEHEVCDSKTCTKDKCKLEACVKDEYNVTKRDSSFKKEHDSADKINQDKLTALISSSIKEAMQTIVKQCRMDDDEVVDRKLKGDKFDKSIRHSRGKHESRHRMIQERFKARNECQRSLKNGSKSSHIKEKRDTVCTKRKRYSDKKGKVTEEARSKSRSKSANSFRTDNRRMTGNVNIYICSEANENAQKSEKSQPPCAESSSETTTDRSNISSSKLVTCIRNKRRKSKEQDSLGHLPEEESSDNSNVSSFVCKSTDSTSQRSSNIIGVCHDSEKEIREKVTELTLTECECKGCSNSDATIDKSDQSFKRSKFVVCDKIEKPCSTIYPTKMPAKSDSDEWSSKSVCSSRNDEYLTFDRQREVGRNMVLCDRKRDEPDFDYYINNLKEDYEIKRKIVKCTCRKQERDVFEDSRCRCREKRRRIIDKENFVQPLSTCACIAEEEEEEDVCTDVEVCQKSTQEPITICREASKIDEKLGQNIVPCTKDFVAVQGDEEKVEPEVELKIEKKEEIETVDEKKEIEKVETDEKQKTKDYTPSRLVKPEVVVLRNILKQQTKTANPNPNQVKNMNLMGHSSNNPKSYHNNSNNPNNRNNPSQQSNPNNSKPEAEPAFLRRFNLRDQNKFMKRPDVKEQAPSQETDNRKSDKVLEAKKDEGDKDNKRMFPKLVKNSFLYKGLKKVIEKTVSPERKSPTEKDKIGEDTSEKKGEKSEVVKKGVDGDQLRNSVSVEGKDKLVPELNTYKMIRIKDGKPESKVAAEKITENDKDRKDGKDALSKPVETGQIERTKDVKEKPKLLAIIESIKESKDGNIKETQQIPKTAEAPTLTKNIELTAPLEDTEVKKKLDDQKQKQAEKDTKIDDHKKKKSELQKPVTEDRSKRRIDLHSESITICDQCAQQKSPIKESKQFTISQCSQTYTPESHTICTNSNFVRCSGCSEHYSMNNRFDENKCNCCCLPISQCTNELMSQKKSCLKKERQFRYTDSQETDTSILCGDKRNWEGCGCRRMVFCDSCRRPRNDCRSLVNCCITCCKPASKCECKSLYKSRSCHMKSMFCLYCDNPREKCACRAPVKRCSCCELPVDLCTCKDQKTIYDGRPVLTERDNGRTMYVTAWKPREEIRRYFSRNLDDLRTDSINECWCREKLKHHNSDDLPYQRLSVFSDVMDELQQKMSESTCCTSCRKIPCCCDTKPDESRDDRKITYCVSPKTRRRLVCSDTLKPKSNQYKCDSSQAKSDRQRKTIVSLCCACKASPCRCKRSKSSQKKPTAKCYYCKTSPCVCIAGECNKSRPCRCTDSPCRTKEKESVRRVKATTKTKNNDEKIICVR